MLKNNVDWAISSQASNRGRFRDYPKGVGYECSRSGRHPTDEDEDIVHALLKDRGLIPASLTN